MNDLSLVGRVPRVGRKEPLIYNVMRNISFQAYINLPFSINLPLSCKFKNVCVLPTLQQNAYIEGQGLYVGPNDLSYLLFFVIVNTTMVMQIVIGHVMFNGTTKLCVTTFVGAYELKLRIFCYTFQSFVSSNFVSSLLVCYDN